MDEPAPVADLVGEFLQQIAGRMEDVAAETGVSYSALYSWATGRRRPGRANLERLAALAEKRCENLRVLSDELKKHLDEESSDDGV